MLCLIGNYKGSIVYSRDHASGSQTKSLTCGSLQGWDALAAVIFEYIPIFIGIHTYIHMYFIYAIQSLIHIVHILKFTILGSILL